MKLNWVPVGGGVHSPEQVQRLFRALFHPRAHASAVVREIDEKIATLPGLAGLRLMSDYFSRAGLVSP
jgi:hypothetical protein